MQPDALSTAARPHFPALTTHHPTFTFGDNAGGSQILGSAVDAMTDYLLRTNVQMGSDYMPASTRRCLDEAQRHAAEMFGPEVTPAEVVFGASSTQNLENLARGLEGDVGEGDEFIVTEEHEANAGPWKSMADRRNAKIKFWRPRRLPDNPDNDYAVGLDVRDLEPLISARTRLVAFTACSNILGSILPVQQIVAAVRTAAKGVGCKKVEISLDCVAYAPHARMDVQAWDVDFAVFSFYKVYGPHVSAMYVRQAALSTSVHSIVHHFLSPGVDDTGYKLQPAGPGYESVWGSTAVGPYIKSLTPQGTLDAGYAAMRAHDAALAADLLSYIAGKAMFDRGVRVVGSSLPGDDRMPTVSFVVTAGSRGEPAVKSKEVVQRVDKFKSIGIRYGHFYAYNLIRNLQPKLDPDDGIIRVSFVHYNTVDDVAEFVNVLQTTLFEHHG